MDFKLLQQIVANIIEAIQNSAVASVRSLKAHVFPSRIINFPKVQEVKGTVVVGNQKNVEKQLQDIKKPLPLILEAIRSIVIPKSVEISNFPVAQKYPEPPKSVEVSNFPPPFILKEIRVSNQPTGELQGIHDQVGRVEKAVKALKLDPKITVEAPKPERVIVPPANITLNEKEIDYDKLAEAVGSQIPGIDYKKLADAIGKKLSESLISGGGSSGGKYAFQTKDGERTYGLVNLLRQLSVVQEDRWQICNSFKSGVTTYTGNQDVDGSWVIMKIVKSTGSNAMTYATIKNNPTQTNYTDAWDNKIGLTYSLPAVAFAYE